MQRYLQSSYYFDFDHPLVQEHLRSMVQAHWSEQEKVAACYLYVRDTWRYNPYHVSFKAEDWKASIIFQRKEGHCIDKSILFITCLRAMGIPARLQLAKVKNHIAVERLVEKLGTNEMTPHGMVNLYLDGQWLKASPAFNKELCEKCNVAPLDFNGKEDSVFQEFNREGKAFMEYVEDYGYFDDLPLDFIIQNLIDHYASALFRA
ncbi:MAG: transglutaminase family protein [Bacteroidota bacterium]